MRRHQWRLSSFDCSSWLHWPLYDSDRMASSSISQCERRKTTPLLTSRGSLATDKYSLYLISSTIYPWPLVNMMSWSGLRILMWSAWKLPSTVIVRRVTQLGRSIQSGGRFIPGCGQEGQNIVRLPGGEDSMYNDPKRFETCNILICLLTLISSWYLFYYQISMNVGVIKRWNKNTPVLPLGKHCFRIFATFEKNSEQRFCIPSHRFRNIPKHPKWKLFPVGRKLRETNGDRKAVGAPDLHPGICKTWHNAQIFHSHG